MPESEWHAPCYKGRRNACRRKREAERLSRLSSDDETSVREKSTEPIRPIVNPYSDVSTTGQSAIERIFGKGFRRRTRSKGSKKRRSRGKRTTKRRRH